ncbi:MAG TPA: ComEC/Rec2 family competence protein, partial [Aestuariivirga sp.]|nr:ComEC/Rec2 family competence protein [Aestuariivirga sp.]
MVVEIWEAASAAPAKPDLREKLRLLAEAQHGRSILWAPVALSFGIWGYFGLLREPSWMFLAPLVAGAALLLWMSRSRPALALLALVIVGFVFAKAKVDFVAAPALHATTAPHLVSGTVEDRSASGRGRQVIILRVDEIEGLAASELPRRLRLTASLKQGETAIGAHVAMNAVLAPLPKPVLPGGFDYGRQLWLDGIGGTGRVTSNIETQLGDAPFKLRLSAALESLRQAIGARIRATLSGVTAAIAEALITGERGGIPRDVNLSFQISGLAHVLSISGLHMVLVAGTVFWAIRAALAAIPSLALRWPIKKWAAGVALAAGFFYMLLAGSGVATQRSYIMIAVMFFAILVDRPAISVRNLALAAVIILALEPDAAIQASFQMSFMAVMGLAAFYEFWTDRRRTRDVEVRQKRHWSLRLGHKLGLWLAASIVTTIVAGAMSSIPAAYHFGRIAPFSVVANGLALPVISFIIMPMALFGFVLMPLGLESGPWWLMGKGIELMIHISVWVADLPHAAMVVSQQSAASAMIMALGAAMLCLWRGPARLAGPVIVIAGLGLGANKPIPDILIDRTAATVAIRDPQGALVPVPGHKGRFAVTKWLLANGEEASP